MTTLEQVGLLATVPVCLEAELDRNILTFADLLALEHGTLIRMGRSAGENIDLYVGGALLGFGEIVVLENAMCVRVTDFHELSS